MQCIEKLQRRHPRGVRGGLGEYVGGWGRRYGVNNILVEVAPAVENGAIVRWRIPDLGHFSQGFTESEPPHEAGR